MTMEIDRNHAPEGTVADRQRTVIERASAAYAPDEVDALARVSNLRQAGFQGASDLLAVYVVDKLHELFDADASDRDNFLAAGEAMVAAAEHLLAVAHAMLLAAEATIDAKAEAR